MFFRRFAKYCQLFAQMQERDKQTDRPRNGKMRSSSENGLSAMSPKIHGN